MKTKGKIAFLILFLTAMSTVVKADVFDDIAAAIRAANATGVAGFCAPSLEVRILDKTENYTRAKAENAMKSFFDEHKPSAFTLVHKGSSAKGAQYAIGSLQAPDGNYRVYIYLKDVQGKMLIEELSFEKE